MISNTSQTTAGANALHSLNHELVRGFAKKPQAQADTGRSHAHLDVQLLVLMQPDGLFKASDHLAELCLSAFADCRLQAAEDMACQSSTDEAAICLAGTYQTLLSIVHQTPNPGAWHQSALWHSRRLHCALLNHLEEYGGHPAIDEAFRAGCLKLCIPPCCLH